MRTLLCLLALLPVLATAQGIAFEPGSWKDAVAKAKAEKKLIFLDTYTTWCGPCKWMDKNVYPDAKVGEKFNAAFVNFKVDAEKGEGIELAKKYQVTAYPTYLFVSADETLVYRTIGSRPAEKFIEEADKALTAGREKPLSAWESEYAGGQRDAEFLRGYLEKRQKLGLSNADLFDAYLATLPADSLAAPSTLRLLADDNHPPVAGGKAFGVLYENRNKLASAGVRMPATMLFQQSIQQTVREAGRAKNPSLLAMAVRANEQVYANAPETKRREMAAQMEMTYFRAAKEFDKYAAAATEYVNRYLSRRNLDSLRKLDEQMYALQMAPYTSGKKDSTAAAEKERFAMIKKYMRTMNVGALANEYNSLAWTIYENLTDKARLKEALGWSKRSLELTPGNAAFTDTYAHLLYKLGQHQEAVIWAQKALDEARASDPSGTKEYEETLAKMKSKTL
jgi:thiol-disulfide isomerase/thioredoxin